MKVTRSKRNRSVEVVADDTRVVSRAGSGLLVGLSDRVELTAGLSEAMCGTRQRRSAHDPGWVLRDLAVMSADGGDCLSDLGALRDQADVFGRVASNATAWRAIDALDEDHLEAVRMARRAARTRAWAAGARPDEIVLDIDSTLALRARARTHQWVVRRGCPATTPTSVAFPGAKLRAASSLRDDQGPAHPGCLVSGYRAEEDVAAWLEVEVELGARAVRDSGADPEALTVLA